MVVVAVVPLFSHHFKKVGFHVKMKFKVHGWKGLGRHISILVYIQGMFISFLFFANICCMYDLANLFSGAQNYRMHYDLYVQSSRLSRKVCMFGRFNEGLPSTWLPHSKKKVPPPLPSY